VQVVRMRRKSTWERREMEMKMTRTPRRKVR
jgi:hypothetical protein